MLGYYYFLLFFSQGDGEIGGVMKSSRWLESIFIIKYCKSSQLIVEIEGIIIIKQYLSINYQLCKIHIVKLP